MVETWLDESTDCFNIPRLVSCTTNAQLHPLCSGWRGKCHMWLTWQLLVIFNAASLVSTFCFWLIYLFITLLPSITLKLKQRTGFKYEAWVAAIPSSLEAACAGFLQILCTKFLQIYLLSPSLFFNSFYRKFAFLPRKSWDFLGSHVT